MEKLSRRSMLILRIACVAVAVGVLAYVGWDAAHWPEELQRAWNTGGGWFVLSWVLAATAVIATVMTFPNPGLGGVAAALGAIGVCMIAVAAATATLSSASEVYVPLLYGIAVSLMVLATRLERSQGRSRRWLLAATWIVLASAVAGVVFMMRRPPPDPVGYVVEMQAVDDGAVLVWSIAGEDHSGTRGWVTRVDLNGRTVWRTAMPDEALIGDSIAIGEGIVTVRYTHRTPSAPYGNDQAVVAYSLSDGALLWDRTLATLDRSENKNIEASLNSSANAAFVDGRLVEWAQSRLYADRALVLEPRTGSIRSQRAWRVMDETLAIGTRVIQHDLDEVASLDLDSGAVTMVKTRGIGCVIGNDYVTIDGDASEAPSLVAFANGDLAKRRVLKTPFAPMPNGAYFRLRRCGRYRDRIVLVIGRSRSDDYTSDTLGSCPYSCVEADFLGGKKDRESLQVAKPKETSREATKTIPSSRRYPLRDPDARRLPVRPHRARARRGAGDHPGNPR